MTFKEFIRDRYPIKDKIRALNEDPIKRIMEQDDLPFDKILSVDGVLQKVVYVSEDSYVTVMDLLSYYPEDVEKMDDKDFKDAYFAYMDNIDITDINIENIMAASKEYKNQKQKKDELLLKCTQ